MLHESTASSHLVQLLQRDLGRKHLPDEEHRQEYQVHLSDELQLWCPAPWFDHQNAYASVLFWGMVQQLWHLKEVLDDSKNCSCFFQAANL